MSNPVEGPPALRSLRRDAALSALAVAAGLVMTALPVNGVLELSPWYLPKVIAVFVLAVGGLSLYLREHLPQTRLGAANQVTLLRLALTALIAGAIGEPQTSFAGYLAAAACLVLVLDGVDGWLARRRGSMSAFGARFDMETDALLVLVMALLVWQLDKAGIWVLLAGVMRYLFVAAGVIWPWLRNPLPPSRRRKTVCVLQILSLLIALAPMVPPPWSAAAAGAGLILLCYSFLVDIVWLKGHGVTHKEALHEGS
jgi:phosphatidylglycerophosphate synthase